MLQIIITKIKGLFFTLKYPRLHVLVDHDIDVFLFGLRRKQLVVICPGCRLLLSFPRFHLFETNIKRILLSPSPRPPVPPWPGTGGSILLSWSTSQTLSNFRISFKIWLLGDLILRTFDFQTHALSAKLCRLDVIWLLFA